MIQRVVVAPEILRLLEQREATDDDLYSYLMYPQVFTEFAKNAREFSDVERLADGNQS
jgi:pyruvate carboxylase